MSAHVFIAEDEASIVSLLKYNLEKEGYNSSSAAVDIDFQAVTILNVLNGFIGFAIDGITGNIMYIGSPNVHIDLDKK